MKRFLFAIGIIVFLSDTSEAAHIIGGEMRYAYVGPGSGPNTKNYKITLWLARGESGAGFAPFYIAAIYNNDNGLKINGSAGTTGNNWQMTMDNPPGIQGVPIILPSCIQGAPILNYTYATYSMFVDLPVNVNGYTIVYQTCCRIDGMVNVGNSVGSGYVCIVPGTAQLGIENDSSPVFGVSVNVICKNAPFTLNFAAVDPDAGDSLVYSLCDAYNGGAAINAGFDNPAAPPYGFVPYQFPYTSVDPFGTGATINSQTGIISGIAPDEGKYVVCVCINVYRNGVRIATHRKDLIVEVSNCTLTVAAPRPDFVTCNGFDVQFFHNSTGANSVFWDFGVIGATNDTSNLSSPPPFTYPDTGTYFVKFVINRGTGCADSVIRKIGVYPGFFPGFTVAGGCFINPYQFTDTTRATYGVVNNWRWNFGDGSTLADTSRIRNPQWTFANAGPKTAQLIVSSSKGCIDTTTVDFTVLDRPIVDLAFRDTLICIPDRVTLNATSTSGTYSWSPLTNISNPNSPNPTVNPTTNTWYVVTLSDNGCQNKDSVHVRVVSNVLLRAIADTTICLTDAVQLNATTNALSFQWTASSGTLSNPNIVNPMATPTAASTTYSLVGTIGSCSATDQVIVNTVPYPVADAGTPQIICYNTSAQLNGSHDGNSFTWSPTAYLNNPLILNPISTPPRTTAYVLTVFDNAGCPKPGRDTVVVTVQPRVRAFAGRDTIVIVGQPLQFNGTGGVSYVWSPSTGLSSTTIYNPVGVYNSSIDTVRYKLVVTDAAGCTDSAYVTVRVFKTKATVFVPTGFTPNNDGLNDIVAPVCVGIRNINYFSIYNRWGQLVFTTTRDRHGWDGKISGRLQGSGVFAWMLSAVDYTGKTIFLKGTVALIR